MEFRNTANDFTDDELRFAEMKIQDCDIELMIDLNLPDFDVCQITVIGIMAAKLNNKPKRIPSAVNRHLIDLK